MIIKKFKIREPGGIGIRAAATFVCGVGKYSSEIIISAKSKNYNGKSLRDIMSAGLDYGAQISVICRGDDEEAAIQKINNILGGDGGL